MTTLVLTLPGLHTRPAPQGPWVWNVSMPEFVPILGRVAWLRHGARVPPGTWYWVLGPLYVSDRRPWAAMLKSLKEEGLI